MQRIILLGLVIAVLASCGRKEREDTVTVDAVRAQFGFASDVVPICGSDSILGKRIPDVGQASPNPGCGFNDAVRVYAVSGIELSPPARMQCRTARITNSWARNHIQPEAISRGDAIVTAHVAADYSCRTRNHKKGARLSEHAKGTAIDIKAFTFASGKRLSVLDNWRGEGGRMMQALFRASCRIWHTAIGPEGDRYHLDHFHFDAARAYGPGGYCR
ncbi:extensin family protein [Shimia ponticola]|uniref:extensin-like domain-containing protein n=1 Tax=Shimia ponticola TaxID=2582893 RepID=UPI00164AA4BA|nr:extensin family protein [Shimia ponticola]